jgi:uncharacterized membrane protein YkvA (DUF1232 family)
LNNIFFDIALKRAARLSGKTGRILLLVAQLGKRMTKVNWKAVSVATMKEKFLVFSRLSAAYASGKYRDVPWKTIMTVLAAIIYFLNPIDLIPDFIPGVGLSDDFGVLLWVYNSMTTEVDKFLAWEKSMTVQK